MTSTRIGIPIIGNSDWIGGVCYVENLIKAVRLLPKSEQPEMHLLFADKDLEALSLHAHFVPLFDSVIYNGSRPDLVEKIFGQAVPRFSTKDELFSQVDFVFPASDPLLGNTPTAGWIPDFQHRHLPQLFSQKDLDERDSSFAWKAANARTIVFSSQDAANDFQRFYPQSKAKPRILSFHTLPEPAWLEADPIAVQQKYGLPDRFLLCSNQLWAHKNHARLFEAVAHMRLLGHPVSLVCTGSNKDYRHAKYFEKLMTMLPELEIQGDVHILGNIPRIDQIQLMRRSLAVVQPSLFEGWSTVVEDARCLGKVMFLSDLSVHIEQAPAYSTYFDRHDAQSLVRALVERLPTLEPGPDLQREALCADESVGRTEDFGRTFVRLATGA
jgi:glycosyltransferase involved in cell wall biosynthesis